MKKIVPRCSWCGALDPAHEGGYERRDHSGAQGNFCKRECYEAWKQAHAILDGVKIDV